MKSSMSAPPHALDTLILGSIEKESEPCDRDSRKNKINWPTRALRVSALAAPNPHAERSQISQKTRLAKKLLYSDSEVVTFVVFKNYDYSNPIEVSSLRNLFSTCYLPTLDP